MGKRAPVTDERLAQAIEVIASLSDIHLPDPDKIIGFTPEDIKNNSTLRMEMVVVVDATREILRNDANFTELDEKTAAKILNAASTICDYMKECLPLTKTLRKTMEDKIAERRTELEKTRKRDKKHTKEIDMNKSDKDKAPVPTAQDLIAAAKLADASGFSMASYPDKNIVTYVQNEKWKKSLELCQAFYDEVKNNPTKYQDDDETTKALHAIATICSHIDTEKTDKQNLRQKAIDLKSLVQGLIEKRPKLFDDTQLDGDRLAPAYIQAAAVNFAQAILKKHDPSTKQVELQFLAKLLGKYDLEPVPLSIPSGDIKTYEAPAVLGRKIAEFLHKSKESLVLDIDKINEAAPEHNLRRLHDIYQFLRTHEFAINRYISAECVQGNGSCNDSKITRVEFSNLLTWLEKQVMPKIPTELKEQNAPSRQPLIEETTEREPLKYILEALRNQKAKSNPSSSLNR